MKYKFLTLISIFLFFFIPNFLYADYDNDCGYYVEHWACYDQHEYQSCSVSYRERIPCPLPSDDYEDPPQDEPVLRLYSSLATSTPCGVTIGLRYQEYSSEAKTFNIYREDVNSRERESFSGLKISPIYGYYYYFTDITAVHGHTYEYYYGDVHKKITFSRPPLVLKDFTHNEGEVDDNSCPFVQFPGSDTSFISSNYYGNLYTPDYDIDTLGLFDGGLYEKNIGGRISDLSCSKNRYAYAASRPSEDVSVYEPDKNISNNIFTKLGSMYGVNKHNVIKEIDMGFLIHKTAAAGYNFYRIICDNEFYDWDPDNSCSVQKLTNSDYTTEQFKTGFFIVNFDQNYTPPNGKILFNYYITSVSEYGSESRPFLLYGFSQVPTCFNECLDPNTLSTTTIFRFKNPETEKFLSWNNTSSKLIQSTYNDSSSDQEWYIKPTNEIKYANIVSKTDNKSLASSGSIDWSWDRYFNGTEVNWPGYLQDYEHVTDNNYPELDEWGYAVFKKTQAQNDDSQKWCFSPYDVEDYDEYGNFTGQRTYYSLINKNTQNSLAPFGLKTSYLSPLGNFPASDDGNLVWIDLMLGGSYFGLSSNYYYENFIDSLWQIDIPITESSCSIPDGSTIPNASSTTYYKSNVFNGDCEDSSNKETRTCTNGVLSGTATSTSCTEFCVINEQNVYSGESVSYYKNSTLNTLSDCQSTTAPNINKITYSCSDNGVFEPKIDSQYSNLVCTYSSVPKIFNLARLVPNIVDAGNQCYGKVDINEMTNFGLGLGTTTCGIYQVLVDGTTASFEYSSGNPMSSDPSKWPGVDPGKDYKIVCKDTTKPDAVTAVSKTLKCVLNPSIREI